MSLTCFVCMCYLFGSALFVVLSSHGGNLLFRRPHIVNTVNEFTDHFGKACWKDVYEFISRRQSLPFASNCCSWYLWRTSVKLLKRFYFKCFTYRSHKWDFCWRATAHPVAGYQSVAQSVVKKAMDDRPHGCIGQADIMKFYDNLPMLRLRRWLLSKGAHTGGVYACIRH